MAPRKAHMTANTKLLEIVKKILDINTEEGWREHGALMSPVADAEEKKYSTIGGQCVRLIHCVANIIK